MDVVTPGVEESPATGNVKKLFIFNQLTCAVTRVTPVTPVLNGL